MKLTARIGLVTLASAALVVGTAGIASAKPKEVSTKKFAKTVCAVYTDIPETLDDFTTSYNAIATTDPAAYQTETVTLATTAVDDITALQTKLKNQYPDVDNGKKISKIFVNDVGEITTEIDAALAKFQAADPNGVAFTGDQIQFETALNVLNAKTLSDPFSKITDQDLIGAFDDEKSCDEVVTIIGG